MQVIKNKNSEKEEDVNGQRKERKRKEEKIRKKNLGRKTMNLVWINHT